MQEYVTCAWSLANKYAVCDRSLFTTKWLEWHRWNHCTDRQYKLSCLVKTCWFVFPRVHTPQGQRNVCMCVCVCVEGGGEGGDVTPITSEVGSWTPTRSPKLEWLPRCTWVPDNKRTCEVHVHCCTMPFIVQYYLVKKDAATVAFATQPPGNLIVQTPRVRRRNLTQRVHTLEWKINRRGLEASTHVLTRGTIIICGRCREGSRACSPRFERCDRSASKEHCSHTNKRETTFITLATVDVAYVNSG